MRIILILAFKHLAHSLAYSPVVLTTVWIELMADPKLFFRKKVITRDHKLIAAGALFLGGFVSRSILDKIGADSALGVGAGIRLLITLSWLFVPGKKAAQDAK